MFRYFFESKPDRFTQKNESKTILHLLKELTNKEHDLKKYLFTAVISGPGFTREYYRAEFELNLH